MNTSHLNSRSLVSGWRNRSAAAGSIVVLIVTLAAVALVLALGSSRAHASSGDAWAAFARDVGKACKAETGTTFVKPDVIVDPFGSETHGLAIVTGKLKAGGGQATILCIYDKKTKKVEIGSELGEDMLKVTKGKGGK